MRTPISQEEISKLLKEITKLNIKEAFDLLPVHIVITDENANLLYANKTVETNTGFSPEECIGKNPADLWGGQMPKEFYETLWRAIKTEKKPFMAEIRNKKKDGTLYWQELRVSPVLDENGEVRFFIGIESNITKYKEDMELQEQLLPVFHKLANFVITSSDTATALKEVVKTICQFTEWQVGEVWMPNQDGSLLRSVFEWSKSDNERFSKFFEITRDTTFAPGVGLPGRVWKNRAAEWIPDVKKESPTIFFRIQAAQEAGLSAAAGFPVLSQGKVVAVIAFFMLTSRKKDDDMVMFINDLLQKLETFFNNKNKEQFKEQFISLLSHQVRNPLTTIRLILGDLLTDSGLKGMEQQELSEVYQKNQALIDLISDLLILARIEGRALQTETTHLDEEIKDGIEAVRKKHPNISITFENELGSVTINVLKSLALQVFLNIMYNAAEHANKESGEVLIKLQKYEQGILFSCHNNGEPIPEQIQPKIFTKVESTTGGAGIGLFIVKMICDYFGWKVWFDTGEDGTTFYVTIPFPNQ